MEKLQIIKKCLVPRALVGIVFLQLFSQLQAQNQKPKILAGPLIGSVTPTTAKIWFAYEGKSDNIISLFDTLNKSVFFPSALDYIKNEKGQIAITCSFKDLKPNTFYLLGLKVGNDQLKQNCSFITPNDTRFEDFSFLTGSCFLLQPGFFKGVLPGANIKAVKSMTKDSADFMIWMGDNLYYLNKEWESYESMFKKQLKVRSKSKNMNALVRTRPNYAIWDDHDYGANNSSNDNTLKDQSLTIFSHFWANESYGKEGIKGIFSSFKYYDCEFFLLDDRYYRDANEKHDGNFLGDAQMAWLKSNLYLSKATFKFIVVGSQVLNEFAPREHYESYDHYKKEKMDLINYISQNNIEGVIFLSGDRHYSELIKNDRYSYPLYDFTCSPVLSFPVKTGKEEKNNPDRVENTLVEKRNYGKISIVGDAGDRSCVLQCFNKSGKLLWEKKIHQNELKKQNVWQK